MNGKSKVILLVLTMLLTMTLLLYMTFSWFDMVRETKPIIIHTGSLRLESALYYAPESPGELEYEQVLVGGISFEQIIPGEKYYFRIYAKNTGTIPGYLSVVLNDLDPTTDDVLQGFRIRYRDPKSPLNEITQEFDQHDGYKLVLFEDVFLIKQEFFTFDFTIEVTSRMSSTTKGQSISISNFLIGLDQIPKNNHPG